MIVMKFILWMCVAGILATYLFYPVSLIVLVRRRRVPEPVAEFVPCVSLVISAYNEAARMPEKLNNALALDYPHDRLQIAVVSDASDDGTDSIVRGYEDRGVVLYRLDNRQGKSAGLTQVVPRLRGEIVIFSDANSMYEPAAVRHLVRHFSDPQIGYVVGAQKYLALGESAAARSEGLYWRYEHFLKRCESRLGSVVGGDGAIYAIRARLFRALKPDDISDFVNPLQIVAQGYRGVFEQRAVCHEAPVDHFSGEFRRKMRIVNRSVRGLWRNRQVLNPLRVGWFAYQVLLHKLIRWFVPFLLAGMLVTSAVLALNHQGVVYLLLLIMQCAFYGLALLHGLPGLGRSKLVSVCFYFVVVNAAAGLGILAGVFGRRYATWNPVREPPPAPAQGA
jgi:cellulose synthase/poly-beta-1,6-N-acetylglucosamine synthase-like glycosyltransferase